MKTSRLVLICFVMAAVLATVGWGHRGFHWFASFIILSGFLIGVGLLANRAFDTAFKKIRREKSSN